MKKMITILGLMLATSTVFAAQGARCIRGGGVSINLPSNAYYLNLENTSKNEIELAIFERNSDASKGDLILRTTVALQKFNQNLQRRTYTSQDGRIFLTTNERQDGN